LWLNFEIVFSFYGMDERSSKGSCGQEVHDLALVSHIAALRSRVPFLHFFDGFRTSHTNTKVRVLPYDAIAKLFPHEEVQKHLRHFALNPTHPAQRGTGQRSDLFFQYAISGRKYFKSVPEIVESAMHDVSTMTGRNYKLFDYVGSPTAERVIVIMGSASNTAEEAVEYMNQNGENVGVLKVRLFRPWSAQHFRDAMPSTVRRIAVLDRTNEDTSPGNPLFMDVCVALQEKGDTRTVIGGTYGLASKEFTPGMVKGVFDHMKEENPKRYFTVGIVDDVTFTSISYLKTYATHPPAMKQCISWGIGGDGSVSNSQAAMNNYALNAGYEAQVFNSYDARKQGGITCSDMRFSPDFIKSEYRIQTGADFISCSQPQYVKKLDRLIEPIKEGGTFLLNCPWKTPEEVAKHIPSHMLRILADRKVEFHVVDAVKATRKAGLGSQRLGVAMQACFYSLFACRCIAG
jgi:Pyruvate/2-oxoacid:ferredoxin oxidoreductase gamma subunit